MAVLLGFLVLLNDHFACFTAGFKSRGKVSYATIMLMSGMKERFCAQQLGHSVQMFQTTYTKWLHGEQDHLEMAKLAAIAAYYPQVIPEIPFSLVKR